MFDEFGDPIDVSGDFSSDGGFLDQGTGDFGISGVGNLIRAGMGGGLAGGLTQRGLNFGMAAVRRGGSIILAGGRAISTTKAWQLVKQLGPELAAGALGYGVADLMAILVHSGAITRRRRRRGISSRDIRTTRRVVRFTQRMIHDIGCVHHARSFPSRRRGAAATASARS